MTAPAIPAFDGHDPDSIHHFQQGVIDVSAGNALDPEAPVVGPEHPEHLVQMTRAMISAVFVTHATQGIVGTLTIDPLQFSEAAGELYAFILARCERLEERLQAVDQQLQTSQQRRASTIPDDAAARRTLVELLRDVRSMRNGWLGSLYREEIVRGQPFAGKPLDVGERWAKNEFQLLVDRLDQVALYAGVALPASN